MLDIARSRRLVALLAVTLLMAACGGGSESPAETASEDQGGETPSPEPEADPYYAGKTIEIILGSSPGGSTDGSARLFAEKLTEYLPGNPTVQVINAPGAGGVLAGNQFANAEKDGLTLMLMGPSPMTSVVMGEPEAEYALEDMVAFWSSAASRVVYFHENTGITSVEQLEDPPTDLYFGSRTVQSVDLPALVAWEALGVLDSIEIIFGYESGDEVRTAYEAGEINTMVQGIGTYQRELAGPQNVLLYTLGLPNADGGLDRDETLPDLPHVGEVYETLHGEPPSGEAWEAYMMLSRALHTGNFSLWTHKDAPSEAIEALDEAVQAIYEDEDFRERMDTFLPFPQIVGEDAREWGEQVGNLPQDTMEWLKGYLTEQYGEDFAG